MCPQSQRSRVITWLLPSFEAHYIVIHKNSFPPLQQRIAWQKSGEISGKKSIANYRTETFHFKVKLYVPLCRPTTPIPSPFRWWWDLQVGLRGSKATLSLTRGSDPPGPKGTKGSEPTVLTSCDLERSSLFRGGRRPPNLTDESPRREQGRH